jgi:hypothetical protein
LLKGFAVPGAHETLCGLSAPPLLAARFGAVADHVLGAGAGGVSPTSFSYTVYMKTSSQYALGLSSLFPSPSANGQWKIDTLLRIYRTGAVHNHVHLYFQSIGGMPSSVWSRNANCMKLPGTGHKFWPDSSPACYAVLPIPLTVRYPGNRTMAWMLEPTSYLTPHLPDKCYRDTAQPWDVYSMVMYPYHSDYSCNRCCCIASCHVL